MVLLKHLFTFICAVSWLALCFLYTLKALLSPAAVFSKSSATSSLLIFLHTRFNGGYHYLEEEFHDISSKAQSLDPVFPWLSLPHFRLLLDDQANKPHELCRSCIGWVIDCSCRRSENIDTHLYVDEVKAKWESHPLIVQEDFKIGTIQYDNCCMSTECMPCYGPFSHLICFIKAYIALLKMTQQRSSGNVLGLLELHLPSERQVVYILPPGSTTDLYHYD